MSTISDRVGDLDGASIGGSGTWALRFPEDLDEPDAKLIDIFDEGFDTPYGKSARFKLLEIHGARILRVAFHGALQANDGERQPIWRRALQVAYVLHEAGTPWAIVDASVGGIKEPGTEDGSLGPGSILIPSDFYGVNIPDSFLEETGLITTRLTGIRGVARLAEPFHSDLRQALYDGAKQHFERVYLGGNYICTPFGPFETAIEVESYRRMNYDVVGRTLAYEAILARVYGYPIAAINIVSNFAEGRDTDQWVEGGLGEFYPGCAEPMSRATISSIKLIMESRVDSSVGQEYMAWDNSKLPVPGA